MFFWRRRHPVTEEELSAYLDGELAGAVLARVEEHVEECGACRETLAEFRAVRQALRELPRDTVPRSFALREAALRPAEAPWTMGALGRATPLLSGVATAAVVVFGVLVGIDLTGGIQSGADEDFAPAALERMSDDAESGAMAPDEEGLSQYGDGEGRTDAGEQGAPVAEGTPEPPKLEERDGRPTVAPAPMEGCEDGDPCDEDTGVAYSGGPTPTPAPGVLMGREFDYDADLRGEAEAGDDGPNRMRLAEAAAAAVALVAGGSLALVWWRRRA